MSDGRSARALAAAVALTLAASPLAAQNWRSVSSARQVAGERALDVSVEYGAGTLRVEPARAGMLYRFEMRYDEDQFRPVTRYDRASGRLRLGMDGRDRRGARRVSSGQRATVSLNPDLPTDLRLEFGAGEADLELGGMSLRRVHLSTGASETRVSFGSANRVAAEEVKMEAGAASLRVAGLGNTRAARFEFDGGMGETVLDFGGTWTRDATAKVDMGVGSLTLRLPRGLGVRVTKSSFLASFDSGGLVKRGDAWYSRNWSEAPHKLSIDIDAAIGSIDIDWID